MRNVMFVVDEVHSFVSKHSIPYNFKMMITRHQADNIGVMSISQRTANVHNDVISQATITIAFKQKISDDAEKLEENVNFPAKKLLRLPYYYFYIDDDREEHNSIKLHKPIK